MILFGDGFWARHLSVPEQERCHDVLDVWSPVFDRRVVVVLDDAGLGWLWRRFFWVICDLHVLAFILWTSAKKGLWRTYTLSRI